MVLVAVAGMVQVAHAASNTHRSWDSWSACALVHDQCWSKFALVEIVLRRSQTRVPIIIHSPSKVCSHDASFLSGWFVVDVFLHTCLLAHRRVSSF